MLFANIELTTIMVTEKSSYKVFPLKTQFNLKTLTKRLYNISKNPSI
jgi:hypothetical protein